MIPFFDLTGDVPLHPDLWEGCRLSWCPSAYGPTGSTLYGLGAYRTNGTLTNMDVDQDWVVSRGGYALNFDGSNDYVALDGFAVSPPCTVCAWYLDHNPSQSNTFAFSMGSSLSNDPLITFGSGISVGDRFRTLVRNDAGTQINIEVTSPAPSAGWAHVGVTVSLTGVRLWVNGVPSAESALTGTWTMNRTAAGVLWRSGLTGHWNGCLDDMRIYDRVLNSSEMMLLASGRGVAFETRGKRYVNQAATFQPAWAANVTQLAGVNCA